MDLDHCDHLHARLSEAVVALEDLPVAVCPAGRALIAIRVPHITRLGLLRPLARRFGWRDGGTVDDGDATAVLAIVERNQVRSQLADLATWQPRHAPLSALRPILDWRAVTTARRVHPMADNAIRRDGLILVAVTLTTGRDDDLAASIRGGFAQWVVDQGGRVDAHHPRSWLSIAMPESCYGDLSAHPFIREARSQRPVNILRGIAGAPFG
jgi:hypothetical protein